MQIFAISYIVNPFSSVQVSNNGVLSFQKPLPHTFSVPFPWPLEDDAIIAPFWDLYSSNKGTEIVLYGGVFYQYSTEESLLQRVGAMVDVFECCFKPKLLFIVTWFRIFFIHTQDLNINVRNYTLLI